MFDEELDLHEPEGEGSAFEYVHKHISNIEEYHPVRRYLARILDYYAIQLLLLFNFVTVLRIRPFPDLLSDIIRYGAPFLAIPIHAAMLHYWGTTPGKWLMGMRIDHVNGDRPRFMQALEREWYVLKDGYGFGIPFWSIWRLYRSYKDSQERQRMTWDRCVGCKYTFHWLKDSRIVMYICAAVLVFIGMLACVCDQFMPVHRGDLTIEQFAENFNDLRNALNDGEDKPVLRDDGTWYHYTPVGNVVIIDDTMSKTEVQDYQYETENGIIKRITYHQEWKDVFYVKPLSSKLLEPAIVLLLSQKGASIFDLLKFDAEWNAMADQTEASVVYKNIEVHWKIESENCTINGDTYTSKDNKGTIELQAEIIVH